MFGNLLTEPLISTDRGSRSLPGLMASMARGEVASFPALRPHQRPAWHMFLVQLGVLALSSEGLDELPNDEDVWRAVLRSLTTDFPDDEPWHLVVEDRAKPAFLQPPDPGGLKWSPVATPDALDMLITARNHDLKREVAQEAEPQDWVFALVSLQTMEGYQLKYSGIVRMNSGASSRVMLTLAPVVPGTNTLRTSLWWRRDVARLLRDRREDGLDKLIWLNPWPNRAQLYLAELDPLFIEVCRRIRLLGGHSDLCAEKTVVISSRIDPNSGGWLDPWAPRRVADDTALTLGSGDFTYSRLNDLIWGKTRDAAEWVKPKLLNPDPDDEQTSMAIVAEAFARGAGGKTRTDGFRSRVIPVPKAIVKSIFGSLPSDESKAQIEHIDRVDAILRRALRLLHCDGDWEKLKKTNGSNSARARMDRSLGPARAAFDRAADAAFFPALWAKLEAGTTKGIAAIHHDFIRDLVAAARAEFHRAIPGIPCTHLMRPRAEARARAAFEAGIRKLFKDLGVEERSDA